MRALSVLLLAASTVIDSSYARVVPAGHVLHEKRDVRTHSHRVKRDRLASDSSLPMRIGLKQSNMQQAHHWLMEVSHPESEKYGQHWSSEDVIEAFKPSDASVNEVMQWLESSGISKDRVAHSDNKLWLAFDASVQEAEDLVHAQYHEYEHLDGKKSAGCDEYHVPQHIQEHIDYITPGVKGSFIKSKSQKRGVSKLNRPSFATSPKIRPVEFWPFDPANVANCDHTITPACIRALYQFDAPSPSAKVSSSNAMGIFEEGDYYSQQDLNNFFTTFTPYIPNGTHPKLDSIDGGQAPVPANEDGGESMLDFELAYPIVHPQAITLYQTDDINYAEGTIPTIGFLNTFLDAIDGSYCSYSAYGETGDDPTLDPQYPDPLPGGYKGQLQCGVYKPTNVISISYGEQENDLPAYYQKRQCNEFLKLGLQGVSIFFASGDSGVAGPPGDPTADGCLRDGTVFSPAEPNSCPYVTNVGATKVLPGKSVYEPESAVNDPAGHPYRSAFYSGGGFSNIYPIPDYQQTAVANYFKVSNPPYPYYYNGDYQNCTGIYNRNGRGYPDVAANGDNIAVFAGGNATLEGGTSASSPIFASIVNRIVEERIKIGKGPVGFINPALYKNPWVLNDITNGSNPGCNTNGFSASIGWDPVTGLGTPNYPRMLGLFLALP